MSTKGRRMITNGGGVLGCGQIANLFCNNFTKAAPAPRRGPRHQPKRKKK